MTDDELHLIPPVFLRLLLGKAAIKAEDIVRVEVMDYWRGSWVLGVRIVLSGEGRGFLLWAIPRRIDELIAWLRDRGVDIVENRATDIARGRT